MEINQDSFMWNRFTKIDFSRANQLKIIGNSVFRNIETLSWDLVIPNNVTRIGEYAFYHSFTGDNNTLSLWTWIERIFNHAFEWNNFTWNLILPESLTYINSNSFCWNNFNWELVIPSKVTNVDRNAFTDNKFTKLNFSKSDSLTYIGAGAFSNMWTVTWALIIPDSVTKVDERAFWWTFTWENNILILWKWLEIIAHNAFNWNIILRTSARRCIGTYYGA